LTLIPKEKQQLEVNARSRKTSDRLLERSKIILLAAEGLFNYKNALDSLRFLLFLITKQFNTLG
jgi:hypothetical protein